MIISRLARGVRSPIAVVVLLVLVLAGGGAATYTLVHAATKTYTGTLGIPLAGPKQYGLFLGDSYTEGYQPDYTTTGYVWRGYSDAWTAEIQSSSPTFQQINMACFGETTATFLSGPCAGTAPPYEPPTGPLYPRYAYPTPTSSQLSAALAFLDAHPGQVSPVEIELGGNDYADACYAGPTAPILDSCVQTEHQLVQNNLMQILTQLKHHLGNQADLLINTVNDPLQNFDPRTYSMIADLNHAVKQAAQDSGAIVLDSANSVWHTDQYSSSGTNPYLCQQSSGPWLWLCDNNDVFSGGTHPHDAGYKAMAEGFEKLTGY